MTEKYRKPKTKKIPKCKIQSIMVIGKRWFDKVNGNTYCAARVYINGKFSFAVPWQYGYENYYEQAAREELHKRGIVPQERHSWGGLGGFFEFIEKNKIAYETSVTDGLKRDMVAWGDIKDTSEQGE